MSGKPKLSGSHIFLISKDGPEWSEPVEAWDTRELAERRCAVLNRALEVKPKKDVFDSLSGFVIYPVPLKTIEAKGQQS